MQKSNRQGRPLPESMRGESEKIFQVKSRDMRAQTASQEFTHTRTKTHLIDSVITSNTRQRQKSILLVQNIGSSSYRVHSMASSPQKGSKFMFQSILRSPTRIIINNRN